MHPIRNLVRRKRSSLAPENAAFSKAAAGDALGGTGGNVETVELLELTELFEDRRVSARRPASTRRTAGGGATSGRPNTGKTGRPLTPRGQLAANGSPRSPRFPLVG